MTGSSYDTRAPGYSKAAQPLCRCRLLDQRPGWLGSALLKAPSQSLASALLKAASQPLTSFQLQASGPQAGHPPAMASLGKSGT